MRLWNELPVPGYAGATVGWSKVHRKWCIGRAGRCYPQGTGQRNWRMDDGRRVPLTLKRAMLLAGASVVDPDTLAAENARPIPGFARYLLCDDYLGQPTIRTWQPRGHALPGSLLVPVPHPWDDRPMYHCVADDGTMQGRQVGWYVLWADDGPPPDEDHDWVLHGPVGVADNAVTNLRWGSREENWLDMKGIRQELRDQAGRFKAAEEERLEDEAVADIDRELVA